MHNVQDNDEELGGAAPRDQLLYVFDLLLELEDLMVAANQSEVSDRIGEAALAARRALNTDKPREVE